MNRANNLLQQNQTQWIIQTVRVFDPQAEIFLFGPGAERQGLPIDIFIKSDEIDAHTRQLIKKQLNGLLLNVDMVCELKDMETVAHLKAIGIRI